jgi:hypothetical protein
MGDATREMCGFYTINQNGTPAPNQPILYNIFIDESDTYNLQVVNAGAGTRVIAACIPLPQP